MQDDSRQSDSTPFKWPTLGDKVKSWDGICDKCGEKYSPETRINAVWSATLFYISCRCSPHDWIAMEVK